MLTELLDGMRLKWFWKRGHALVQDEFFSKVSDHRRLKIRKTLFKNKAAFGRLDFSGIGYDLHGWNWNQGFFLEAVKKLNGAPSLIIEVGSWKGLSAVNMAKHIKAHNIACEILCIDTWLGSWEHWYQDRLFKKMLVKNLRPRLYEQFIYNIIHDGVADIITPFPQTSSTAYQVLKRHDVKADIVYIDGTHEQGEVYADLKNYWDLLRPGGILFGDDYCPDWVGVVHDVNLFAKENAVELKVQGVSWMMQKMFI